MMWDSSRQYRRDARHSHENAGLPGENFLGRRRNGISLSAPWGGEGRGEVGIPSVRLPASPSHAGACPRAARCADPWGVGPFLSPLKGGEGLFTGRARCCACPSVSAEGDGYAA
jgi:hypothetical protein